jgi:hypothetical protein
MCLRNFLNAKKSLNLMVEGPYGESPSASPQVFGAALAAGAGNRPPLAQSAAAARHPFKASQPTSNTFINTFTTNFNSLIKRKLSEHKFYMNFNHEIRPRLVKKCGELNIDMESVPKRKRRLLSDFFNTVLDVRWRWHIIIFMLTFLISWILFATVWYLIGKRVFLNFNLELLKLGRGRKG